MDGRGIDPGERRSPERNSVTLGPDPEMVVHYKDPVSGVPGYVVIDSLAAGVAFGGVRCDKDLNWTSLAEIARISTIRFQLLRVKLGGARLGIAYDPKAPDFEEVLGRFLRALQPLLQSTLSLGPDMNVSVELLDRVLAKYHLPWRMHAVQAARQWSSSHWELYQKILDEKKDGVPIRELQLPFSVSEGVMQITGSLFRHSPTVAVMGSGLLGTHVARLLNAAGATVVAVAGASGGVYAVGGLSNQFFNELEMRESLDPTHILITPDEFYSLPVDVIVLASSTSTLTIDNVGRVRAGVVAEAAVNSVSRHAEKVLVARGIQVLPSFLLTIGNLFESVIQNQVKSSDEAMVALKEQVQTTVHEVARLATSLRISLREAGVRLAFHRLEVPPELMPPVESRQIAITEPLDVL